MNQMVITSGDWIAIGIGAMASFRWAVDAIGKWLTRNTEDAKTDAAGLALLRHDHDIHVAADDLKFEWIKESLERMERQLSQLQSQVRFVAVGAQNRIHEIGKKGIRDGP